tara:strand:- start:468 stop:617 length:150 start_codon:yes stop_codon:yes gene_type:complete
MKEFDVFPLLTQDEKDTIGNTIAEAVTRHGHDLNNFDYNIHGVFINATS